MSKSLSHSLRSEKGFFGMEISGKIIGVFIFKNL